MKPYYQDDLITLYHADHEDGKLLVPELSFDVLITDPPYGIDLPTDFASRGMGTPKHTKGGNGRRAACKDYPKIKGDDKPFDPAWLLALNKPSVLWGANHYADKLPPSPGWLVWDKLRPEEADQTVAELAWTNYVKGVRVFRHLWNGMIRASEHGDRWHPTQKPAALSGWILDLRWTPKEGIILDPYVGAGGLLVAAKLRGRKAIGIDREEQYCEIAATRLLQPAIPFWNE